MSTQREMLEAILAKVTDMDERVTALESRPARGKGKSKSKSIAEQRADGPVCGAHGGTCGRNKDGRFTAKGAEWHAEHNGGEF